MISRTSEKEIERLNLLTKIGGIAYNNEEEGRKK